MSDVPGAISNEASPTRAAVAHPNVSARKTRGTTPRRFTVERKDMELGLYLASTQEIKSWIETTLNESIAVEGDAFVDSLNTGETIIKMLNHFRQSQAAAFQALAAAKETVVDRPFVLSMPSSMHALPIAAAADAIAQPGVFAARAVQNFATIERACRELGLVDASSIGFHQFGHESQRKPIVLFLLALKQRLGDETPDEPRSAAAPAAAAANSQSLNRNLFNSPAPVAQKQAPLSLQPEQSGETPDEAGMPEPAPVKPIAAAPLNIRAISAATPPRPTPTPTALPVTVQVVSSNGSVISQQTTTIAAPSPAGARRNRISPAAALSMTPSKMLTSPRVALNSVANSVPVAVLTAAAQATQQAQPVSQPAIVSQQLASPPPTVPGEVAADSAPLAPMQLATPTAAQSFSSLPFASPHHASFAPMTPVSMKSSTVQQYSDEVMSSARRKLDTDSAMMAASLLSESGLATPALHNVRSAMMDQIRGYQQQLHDLKVRLSDREAELDTLRRQLYAAQAELQKRDQEALSGQTGQSDAMQLNLQSAVASLRLCISNHESTISFHKTELVHAQAKVKVLESTLQQKDIQLQQEIERRSELKRELDAKLSDLRERDRTIAEQLSVQASMTRELDGMQSHLATLQHEHERHRKARAEQVIGMLQEGVIQPIVDVKKEYTMFRSEIMSSWGEMQQMVNVLAPSMQKLVDANQRLAGQYNKEREIRKKLQNDLIELRGNIRVFCRVRPSASGDACTEFTGEQELIIRNAAAAAAAANKAAAVSLFQFDRVFNMQSTQAQVFAEVAPFVQSCIDGYNVCIFAYGQTGSGKTYTMEGPASNPGVNYRALGELFNIIEARAAVADYTVSVSVVEIYNETPKDLLAGRNSANANKLDIRVGDAGVYIPDLTEARVNSVEQVMTILRQQAYPNRSVGQTSMNELSSRSHCLLFVNVTGRNKLNDELTTSKLVLVDLAGSERVGRTDAEGARLKEAQHINKSLSALGDVIAALKTHQSHVPFRNSKLTFLLQDCLSGSSKSLMFCNVSPQEDDRPETLCSLKFAERVRACELGPTSKGGASAAEMAKMKTASIQAKDEAKSLKQKTDELAKALQQAEHESKQQQQSAAQLQSQLRQREADLKHAEDEKLALQEKLRQALADLGKTGSTIVSAPVVVASSAAPKSSIPTGSSITGKRATTAPATRTKTAAPTVVTASTVAPVAVPSVVAPMVSKPIATVHESNEEDEEADESDDVFADSSSFAALDSRRMSFAPAGNSTNQSAAADSFGDRRLSVLGSLPSDRRLSVLNGDSAAERRLSMLASADSVAERRLSMLASARKPFVSSFVSNNSNSTNATAAAAVANATQASSAAPATTPSLFVKLGAPSVSARPSTAPTISTAAASTATTEVVKTPASTGIRKRKSWETAATPPANVIAEEGEDDEEADSEDESSKQSRVEGAECVHDENNNTAVNKPVIIAAKSAVAKTARSVRFTSFIDMKTSSPAPMSPAKSPSTSTIVSRSALAAAGSTSAPLASVSGINLKPALKLKEKSIGQKSNAATASALGAPARVPLGVKAGSVARSFKH